MYEENTAFIDGQCIVFQHVVMAIGVFTPTSSGRAYEILVVIDQGLWSVLPVVLSMMYLILTYLGFPSWSCFIPYYVYFSANYDSTLKSTAILSLLR